MNSWLKHSIYFLIGFYYTQSTLFSGELRHPFQGIRNLGMGNVGVASSYDENALIYNPAGLAAVDDMIVSITADVEYNSKSADLVKDIIPPNELNYTTLQNYAGETLHLRLQPLYKTQPVTPLKLVVPFGSLAFGLIHGAERTIDFTIDPSVSTFEVSDRNDKLTSIGIGISLDRGRWLIGASSEQYTRCDEDSNILFSKKILSNGCTEGKGSTYRFGVQKRLTTFPFLRMVSGFAVRNLGGLKFKSDNGTFPIEQKNEFDIGFSITPFNNAIFRNIYEINIKDFTKQNSDESYCLEEKKSSGCNSNRLHIGAEFGFWPFDTSSSAIAIRLGSNQGNQTIGFELNPLIFFKAMTLQYAEYTIIKGSRFGEMKEKRKVFQINLGF